MSDPRIIALLPMKGHSERVPNKNLRMFAGAPLYHAVMKALLASKLIREVVINTDSLRIQQDAEENFDRVRIVPRPPEIQGDHVSMNRIIEHDLSHSEGDIYIQTHSTNPLLRTETINAAIESFLDQSDQCDSLFSVTPIRSRFYYDDGSAVNHNPDELLRTQDLPALNEENSNFYIFTKESFFGNAKRRIGKTPLLQPMNKLEALDIDDPEDFFLAEKLYESREELYAFLEQNG